MVLAAGNPLNSALLNNIREEPRVHGLALGVVAVLTVGGHVVQHLKVLLKRGVHKGDPVGAEFIVGDVVSRLVLEPLDLGATDAVTANLTEALPATVANKPEVSDHVSRTIALLKHHPMVEVVLYWRAHKLEFVLHWGGVERLVLHFISDEAFRMVRL